MVTRHRRRWFRWSLEAVVYLIASVVVVAVLILGWLGVI